MSNVSDLAERVVLRAGLRSGLVNTCPDCGRPMEYAEIAVTLDDDSIRWTCTTCGPLRRVRVVLPDNGREP